MAVAPAMFWKLWMDVSSRPAPGFQPAAAKVCTLYSGLRTVACPVGTYTSIVHRYGTIERAVELRRVPSCQNRVPTETRRNLIRPDGTRRAPTDHSTVPYQCTTHTRTYTGPYGTLAYPDGTQPNPSSLTSDWVRQCATRNAGARPPPFWLVRPGTE